MENLLVDCKSMSKEMRKSTKPTGTKQCTMYGLCKVGQFYRPYRLPHITLLNC